MSNNEAFIEKIKTISIVTGGHKDQPKKHWKISAIHAGIGEISCSDCQKKIQAPMLGIEMRRDFVRERRENLEQSFAA